jgi:serine/threonine-protein kinase
VPEGGLAFGRYRLIKRLAYGGMGEIFLGRHEGVGGFDRLLVIKRLLTHYRSDTSIVTMFFDEARLQALMNDRHIVQIWDMGEVDGQYFIAMEYVSGPSMRGLIDRLKKSGQHIHPAHAVDLFVQVCRGLSYAHNLVDGTGKPLQLVHRDVNPHNVLIGYTGEAKIIDFGIAKSEMSGVNTQTGTIKGKFAYMSPEQARAEPLDRRSDIFALGICLYELLTTKNPFYRKNVVLSLEAICQANPPTVEELRPAVAALSPVVERCLMKEPDERFADCAELSDALMGLYTDGLCGEPPEPLSDWIKGLFAKDIEKQSRFLKKSGLETLQVKAAKSTTSSGPSPYGVGAEITSRNRSVSQSQSDPGSPPAPEPLPDAFSVKPTEVVDTIPTATNMAVPSSLMTMPSEEVEGPFYEDTLLPEDEQPTKRGGLTMVAALLAGVLAAFAVLGWWVAQDAPDRSLEGLIAHAELKLLGESPDGPGTEPGPGPGGDPIPGASDDAGAAAAAPVGDAGAAEAPAPTPPTAEDAGVVLASTKTPGEGEGEGETPEDPGGATVEDPKPSDPKTPRTRRSRRGRKPPKPDPVTEPDPEPVVVGQLTLNAGGPWRIASKGVKRKNTAQMPLLEGQTRKVSIVGGAPFTVRLSVTPTGEGASVRLKTEPWAIVVANNIGKGKTPQTLRLRRGQRLRLQLKNPAAGEMTVSLGLKGP